MDDVTSALRAMYEAYPYPPIAAPEQRVGWDVNLLLSYGASTPSSKNRVVLDAGCGRGMGVLGAASLQPDVTFVGVDVNRVALAEAKELAKARRLSNVTFHEVDLTTLEGLDIPQGGFDAIFSSGVVHHMADPAAGLKRLSSVLAPHGMLQLMVYGSRGREPLYRMVRAMDRLLPREYPIEERLLVARQLANSIASDAVSVGPWGDIGTIGDAEFVDRYLNVNERSYDVPSLFSLLDAADLRFVRWTEPSDWHLESLIRCPPLVELAARLPKEEQFALIDELSWRPKLELVASGRANQPRKLPSPSDLMNLTLRVNPEVSFVSETRNVALGQRVEKLSVRVRRGTPIGFGEGLAARAVLFLKDTTGPFKGSELVLLLGKSGLPPTEAQELVSDLVRAEILYVPP